MKNETIEVYLPEVIDTHCHARGMKQAYKTTYKQTLKEAISALISHMISMPNTDPPITTIDALERQLKIMERARRELGVKEYQYLYFGITDDNLDQCKVALHHPQVVGLKDYPLSAKGKTVTTGTIGVAKFRTRLEGAELVAKKNKVYARHCDNPTIIFQDRKSTIDSFLCDLYETIRVAELVPEAKFVIVHVPCRQGVEAILKAQAKGSQIAIEICPHYLMFSSDKYNWQPGIDPVFYHCFNPLFEKGNLEYLRLLLGVRSNELIFISSDNAPHTRREKLQSKTKGKWIGGLPTNQEMVPAIVTLALLYGWPWSHVANLLSFNASKFFGIPVSKELKPYRFEKRVDDIVYNRGKILNPWNGLEMYFPARKEE